MVNEDEVYIDEDGNLRIGHPNANHIWFLREAPHNNISIKASVENFAANESYMPFTARQAWAVRDWFTRVLYKGK